MRAFAREARRCLASDAVCAVLIGDVRRAGDLEPLGFRTMNEFVGEGFALENIIVKLQHRDRSSEFYFHHPGTSLLMTHEYLFVFKNVRANEPRLEGHAASGVPRSGEAG